MCVLTVDPLQGTRTAAGVPPYEVIAQGGADCDEVNISFDHAMTADGRRDFPGVPVVSGRWMLVFRPPHADLVCDTEVGVTVSCVKEPACHIDKVPRQLQCRIRPPHCPDIELRVVDVGICDANGKRPVTLRAEISGAVADTTVYWDFGDAADSFSQPHHIDTGSDVWTRDHSYTPGAYHAKLIVDHPSMCEPHVLTIGPLTACDAACPTIVPKFGGAGGCDSQGRRLVTVGATVSGASTGTLLQVNYDDGTFSETKSVSGNSTFSFAPHPYLPPGPYRATIVVVDPRGCPSATLDIPRLEPCTGGSGPTGPTGPGPTDGSSTTTTNPPPPPPPSPLCRALEANWMIWLIVGIVFGVLALCAATEGTIIAAVVAAITGGSGATIAAIVGYITLFLLLVTVGAIVAALICFVLWVVFCRPSDCRVWEDFLWAITWAQLVVAVCVFFCPHIVVPIEIVLSIANLWAQDVIASRGCQIQRPRSLPWTRN